MPAADTPDQSAPAASADTMAAAFRELHGPTLHGFALLVTLGDRHRAALLANDALDAAADDLAGLRHPERAAAWLRRRVADAAKRGEQRLPATERLAALSGLRVGPAALAGLSALSTRQRAGLVAIDVERLDRRDVAAIVGRDGGRLDALLRSARLRYLEGATATPDHLDGPAGPIAQSIALTATRTMA
jgi:DNA-directed RNA polymerase specialized sigma24 family protein